MQELLSLSQAGPVAILLAGFALFFRAIIRGDLVPGWLYKSEQEQRQKAETQAERNAESLALLAKALNGGNAAGAPNVR
jgi:hypothetical protein